MKKFVEHDEFRESVRSKVEKKDFSTIKSEY